MIDKKQMIIIKGTKDGLTLFIEDQASFEEVMDELSDKLAENNPSHDEPVVSVTVKLGNRYLNDKQKKQLSDLIGNKNRFSIQSFDSEVIRRDEAITWKEDSEIKSINRIVRSGQVLEVVGDLLLIGDVNPGGKVVTTGNIFIMGSLRGIAHAGLNGDRDAVIAASYMKPSQLRIADYISRAPDYESEGVYMECGLIDEKQDKIVIDRLQVLSHKRKEISGFERRMQNG
ncbi:septum site-determining protein MinC [Virgibacillus subterraneus]|uniref:Probable septum site-determining protein MinC n=2 Tax=Virgibacillus TaxID=84406 RepID=A0A1H1B326_9BACI|nr:MULTISPECIES: septum site-determining protein MinC [Virgibacillus]SDQ46320.1 septum site-determining protein MinC [Virgibacillus salinus]SEQ14668.1 septum site-determining protein MinC [Virgibacillus subterraneus]